MTEEEQQKIDRLTLENETLWRILVSRNKLIEDLVVELPLTRNGFDRASKMCDRNWAKDKAIWDEVYHKHTPIRVFEEVK